MKALTIAQMTLRVAGLLVLILGIAFWAGWLQETQAILGIHMILGIIVVLALWTLGVLQSRIKGGSLPLAFVAIAVGLIVIIVGEGQTHWKTADNTTIINTIHLLLGLLAIGTGEMIGARGRRLAKATI
jgi:hypothetical protein